MDYVRIIRDLREQKSRLDSAIAQLEALEGSGAATRSPRGRKSMGEAQRREVSARIIPESDHDYAYRSALRAEKFALVEYSKVLRIYSDLVTNGIIPDEAEWLKVKAANACGSESE